MSPSPPDDSAAGGRPDGAGRRACAICGKPQDPKLKPFCSPRCADIDLSRWLKGVYAVPAEEAGDPDEEDFGKE